MYPLILYFWHGQKLYYASPRLQLATYVFIKLNIWERVSSEQHTHNIPEVRAKCTLFRQTCSKFTLSLSKMVKYLLGLHIPVKLIEENISTPKNILIQNKIKVSRGVRTSSILFRNRFKGRHATLLPTK